VDKIERIERRLKLHDVRVLMSVVQAGGMRKAAAELGTSQPAISRSISTWNMRSACVFSIAVRAASSRRPMVVRSSNEALRCLMS